MAANELRADEREEIRAGIEREESCAKIGARIGRDASTVSRDIARNGGRDNYRAVEADRRACRNRRRPKTPMLIADPELAEHVRERLAAKDSPWTVSVELANGTHGLVRNICPETIYQGIYNKLLSPDKIKTPHLKRFKRCSRTAKSPGYHPLAPFVSVHDWPLAAVNRSEVGHLEGDLIVGAYNRSALITLVDRLSRYLWLVPVLSKSKDDVYDALIKLYETIPQEARKTLTWDQGAEIARHRELAINLGIDIYVADAKSPWQRPSNENMNAHVRRYVGKGTNLNLITNQELQTIQTRINTTPRRMFNKATANDIYTQAMQ